MYQAYWNTKQNYYSKSPLKKHKHKSNHIIWRKLGDSLKDYNKHSLRSIKTQRTNKQATWYLFVVINIK